MAGLFLRNNQRLGSNEQFRAVMAHKCCFSKGLIRVYAAGNNLEFPRIGISVSKKCGNAVTRNRFKRLGREVFRVNQHNIGGGYDYLLILSPKLSKKGRSANCLQGQELTFEQMQNVFLELAEKCVNRVMEKG